jgi:hypothetical protein
MSDGPEWFAPKRYGYGAGLPISWQGWALTIAFLVVVIGIGATLEKQRHPIVGISVIIPITVLFVVICARTTRGGWRWRWGEED